uniref:Uncharacterized protein n=1 Tax=viral metagenome TaxID=1070528 RepID=A0A6C0H4T5_9ZZZZ
MAMLRNKYFKNKNNKNSILKKYNTQISQKKIFFLVFLSDFYNMRPHSNNSN